MRTLQGSPCHRCPACASFPPTGPALRATRLPARAQGSGSPVPACAGLFRLSRASDNKKPSGAAGSGGLHQANCRYRLREIVPMSRACAVDWQQAIRRSQKSFVSVLHHAAHVGSRTQCSRRPREVRPGCADVKRQRLKFANCRMRPAMIDLSRREISSVIYENFRCLWSLICPTGKSVKTCPALSTKIFCFTPRPNHRPMSRYPLPTRGAFRDRHERWVRGAMDARCRQTSGIDADGKVVWS